jgi:spore germination cell wall hydrolase CwlJ-like protein
MIRKFRAAGLAAAILLALSAPFAAPSFAWEGDSTPLPPSYIDQKDALLGPTEQLAPPPEPDVEAEPQEAPARRPLAELVGDHATASTSGAEQDCLAGAVFFEAKGESLQGQLSVAEVVLNRASSGRFPSSVCGVVRQRGQFSFIRGGRFPAIPRASAAWRKAVAIAHIAMEKLSDGPAPRALFFHAARVSPGWRGLTRVAKVGNHIFYR